VLRTIERKWNLPTMTWRDANAADLLDCLDLHGPPAFATPPALAAPAAPAPCPAPPPPVPPPGAVVTAPPLF